MHSSQACAHDQVMLCSVTLCDGVSLDDVNLLSLTMALTIARTLNIACMFLPP